MNNPNIFDIIYVNNDNTALSGFRLVINAANQVNKPVIVSDIDALEYGALAAIGPNQYDIGRRTGKILADYLNGKDVSKYPIQYPDTSLKQINLNIARKFAINIPINMQQYIKNI
jgi:putative ABC transport system substrate-binding protein